MTAPKCIVTLLLAAVLSGTAFAQPRQQQQQQTAPPEDSIVRLISAEKAWQITENGVNYRRVQGDARFLHNDTYLLCDSASWNVDSEIIEAYGNVRLMQDETMLTSDQLTYLISESLAQFKGSLVELLDKDGNRLRTRQLDYNTKDSLAFFENGGAMKSKDGNVIEGLHGTYDSRTKTFTFEEDVKLFMDSILMKTDRPPRLVLDPDTGSVKVVGGREARKDVDYEEIRDIQFLEDMRDPKSSLLDEPLDRDTILGPESLGAKDAAEKAEELNSDKDKKSMFDGF